MGAGVSRSFIEVGDWLSPGNKMVELTGIEPVTS
jgi:hypothetical protein